MPAFVNIFILFSLNFFMFDSTKIKKRVDIGNFIKLIQSYSQEQIECTQHTFFRLSQKQRKIFTCENLKIILKQEKPFLVGIQHNDNHTVFYRYKNKNLKIIL
jgi:hypothetical protein